MYEEGKAVIKHNSGSFLNPVARASRDMSVAFVALNSYRNTRILDSTAATGIRGIRYYLETKAKDITLLDINKTAYVDMVKNLKANHVKATALQKSIQEFANTTTERFDIIDLDPFGSITPNLYDLFKVAKDQGYLMLTATDTAVLCGAQEAACRRIYDAKPMHNELCQEVGMRILAGYVAKTAAQFNYGIRVLLSVSYAHYMRLFIQLRFGAEHSAESSVRQMGYAYYCSKCGFHSCERSTFPKMAACPNCKSRLGIAGKLWAGNIYDNKVAREMLDYMIKNRLSKDGIKLLTTISQESDIPLYYSVSKMTKKLKSPGVSPYRVIDALRAAGYTAQMTHFDSSSIRTDAPVAAVKKALNTQT